VRHDGDEVRAAVADIPGVCGIVKGSILPGYLGLKRGSPRLAISFYGSSGIWFLPNTEKTQEEKFRNLGKAAAKQGPGESGLLALDWNNGNRCILTDARLSGLLVGNRCIRKPTRYTAR